MGKKYVFVFIFCALAIYQLLRRSSMADSHHIIYQNMKDHIDQGNVSLFIGAGLSKGAGLPGWIELMHGLAIDYGIEFPADEKHITASNLLEIGEKCFYNADCSRHEILSKVSKKLNRADIRPTEVQKYIPYLGCKKIFTTNYDQLIETAYLETQNDLAVIRNSSNWSHPENCQTTLYKITGCVTDLDHMCFTQDDFDCFLDTRPEFDEYLKVILRDTHMLYLGYSLRDPFFWKIWSPLVKTYGDRIKKGWAVFFNLDDYARKRLQAMQITPLVLEPKPDQNTALLEFLKQISDVSMLPTCGQRYLGL
jgi:hypothetical protein